ncbi:DNA-binding transcriptional regulator, ArsR family [Catalinimonas alkaloidigena]|uniref:DNA-binding transcriptional regulator, ArsR family n=1 Tax=Catalinimonas alkaloidigena TaxID=1075417 RepID=A0A1G8WDK4_9BACT|nr:metalloregulator ArsR/SmtB family transcription factor [Catalinimonas alkaloidigena]SDJ76409.1 DNA-binding transcriptional regulator, ArsR family [Catalinimonas alkaloidigena]
MTTSFLSTKKLEGAALILKTMAHPLRLGIVDLLRHYKRLSVNEICEHLGSEQSLTSHHLTGMRLKGLLFCEREGKNMYYSLRLKEISQVVSTVEELS